MATPGCPSVHEETPTRVLLARVNPDPTCFDFALNGDGRDEGPAPDRKSEARRHWTKFFDQRDQLVAIGCPARFVDNKGDHGVGALLAVHCSIQPPNEPCLLNGLLGLENLRQMVKLSESWWLHIHALIVGPGAIEWRGRSLVRALRNLT